MPKILIDSLRNNLSIEGLALRHDELLDQPVRTTSDVTFNSIQVGDFYANGNIFLTGKITEVETTHLVIKDNIIDINKGNDSLLKGGFSIHRGSGLIPFNILYDENFKILRIGFDESLQAVATRQDEPLANHPLIWNPDLRRFDTTKVLNVPLTHASDMTMQQKLVFQPIGLSSVHAPSISGSNSGNLLINGKRDIILGSEDATIGQSVIIPFGRRLSFGETHLYADPMNRLIIDSTQLDLISSAKISWSDASKIYAENSGLDLRISASVVSLSPTTSLSITNSSPVIHGDVGRLQPINGSYSLSSSGDIYMTPGDMKDVVVPNLSFNKSVRFVGDLSGNLNVDALGDIFLSPNKNVVLNVDKKLCFGDPSNFATVNVATGHLVFQSDHSIVLNTANAVKIQASLHIAKGTTIYEDAEGTSVFASNGDIDIRPGSSSSVNLPGGVALKLAAGETIMSHNQVLAVHARSQIVLSATSGVQIAAGTPLLFSDEGHKIYQPSDKDLHIISSHQLKLKAPERIHLDTSLMTLRNSMIYEDVDHALTLSSGFNATYVKTAAGLLINSTETAVKELGTAALMTKGGIYVGQNLVVNESTTMLSPLTVQNTVTIGNTTVPVRVMNRSDVDGTGIGFTSTWDFTGGYTIGRGTPDTGGGRSLTFTLPPFTTYGMGTKPCFSFGSVSGDEYVKIDEEGLKLIQGALFLDNRQSPHALIVHGQTELDSLTILQQLSVGNQSLLVSPNRVTVNTSLQVSNALHGLFDNGNQILFKMDTSGNDFHLHTHFYSTVTVDDDCHVKGTFRSGRAIFSGDVNLQSHRLFNLPNPEDSQEPATKYYVDSFLRGMSAKEAVMAASEGNHDLAAPIYNIDGVPLSTGDRILLKSQTDPIENGIYILDKDNIPSRTIDVPANVDVAGSSVFVSFGDTYGTIGFVVVGNPVIVGQDPLVWTPFTGASQIAVGKGLSKSGNHILVNTDDTTLHVNDNNHLAVAPGFISSRGLEGGSNNVPVATSSDQSHVTKLGTITSGFWNAERIPVKHGGTGSSFFKQGSLVMGNGEDPLTHTDELFMNPVTKYFGIHTMNPTSNIHILNVPNSSSGTWLRVEDTSEVLTQSSGIGIKTVTSTANIALRATGLLYIGQDSLTNNSKLTLATQRKSRLTINHIGHIVLGDGEAIEPHILTIYGDFISTGSARVNGELHFPHLTVKPGTNGSTILDSPRIKVTQDFDVSNDATIGHLQLVSSSEGETSLISMHRVTQSGLPLYLRTGPTETSAVCFSDMFYIPHRLRIGGTVDNANSGVSVFGDDHGLYFTSHVAHAKVKFDAQLSSGYGLSLYDNALPTDFVTMQVKSNVFNVQTQANTITLPYSMVIGGGTNEMIVRLTNLSQSASVTYDPTDATAEFTGGRFAVSNGILSTFGSEVRLTNVMRFTVGNGMEGSLGNVGWYYLGRLAVGRTTLTASLSWRIRIDYDGVTMYNVSITTYDRNVAALVIYRDDLGDYHLFLRIISTPCRVSVLESPNRLILSRFEGAGVNPDGKFSKYSTMWTLDLDSSQAQSNSHIECGDMTVLGSASLYNTVLQGQTSLIGNLDMKGDATFVGEKWIFSDPSSSLPKISMQTEDETSNVLTIHGNNVSSPALLLDRESAQGSISMVSSVSSDYAGALHISHDSDTPSSQIILSTRKTPSMLITSKGAIVVLSSLDSFNPGSSALEVKGGVLAYGHGMFQKGLYTTELHLMNANSGETIPIFCDNDMSINVAESRISKVADPVDLGDAVNMRFVQGLVQGLSAKESVAAASAQDQNVDVNQVVTILDEIVLSPGHRILLKNQINPVENGIYVVQYGAPPERSGDLSVGENAASTYVFVSQGTENAHTGWICSTPPGHDVVGVNALTFTQFSGAGQFNAGPGITKTGNTLQVSVDGISLEISNNNLRVSSLLAGQGLSGGSGTPLRITSISHLDTLGIIRQGTWNANVIGMTYGGTGSNQFAVGRVPFSNGVRLTQGSLYFDEANVRLGINTTAPTSGLTLRDRDFQVHQTVANVPSAIFSSSLTNYTFAIRNDSTRLIVSSGSGTNKTTLNDTLSLDNTGVLTVGNGVRSNLMVLGNATRFSARTIESLSSGPFAIDMFSLDNSGSYLNIYGGMGTSTNHENSESMRFGFYNGGFIVQTTSSGLGTARDLCLQSGNQTNQLVLQPTGSTVLNSTFRINSTADAVSSSQGGAFTVQGGGAFARTLYARRMVTNSTSDDAVTTAGGIVGAKLMFKGTNQDYRLEPVYEGHLLVSGTRSQTDTSLHIVSHDADNDNSVSLRIFGLGKSPTSIAEWLYAGYDRSSASYSIRTEEGGAANVRPLTLSATKNVNQLFLDTDGSVAFASDVYVHQTLNIASVEDATGFAHGGALHVAGGASISKTVHIGGSLRVPEARISNRIDFVASGSSDSLRVNYTSQGNFNLFNNELTAINVHTGNSLGPSSPNQEKIVIGYGSANHHVIHSTASGTGTLRDLVLTTGSHGNQIRLHSGDGSVHIGGECHLLSTMESESVGTGALQVAGGISVRKTARIAGKIEIGNGTSGDLVYLHGTRVWKVVSGTGASTNSLILRPHGQDSILSFADNSDTRLFTVNALNKSCTSSVDLAVTSHSRRAFAIQGTGLTDLFVFDTTQHILDIAGGRVTNVGYPQLSNDCATKSYVDNLIKGLNLKAAARAAAAHNVDLTKPVDTIDAIVVQEGWRILLMFQTNAVENGIYVVLANHMLMRSSDLAVGSRAAGAFCFVEMGEFRGDKGYVCITDYPNDLVGTHALAFTQFNGNIISAGLGLMKDGNNVMNINLDSSGSGLSFNGNRLRIDPEFAGAGLEITEGKLNVNPITKVDTIVSGTWQGTRVAVSYGGTGNNHFPANRVVFSTENRLTSSPKLMWDNDVDRLDVGGTVSVHDGDVVLVGNDPGIYMGGDSIGVDAGTEYNWGIYKTIPPATSIVKEFEPQQPWRNIVMSKDGQTMLLLSDPHYPDYISLDSGYVWRQIFDDSLAHSWGEVVMSYDGTVILACASQDYLYVSNDRGNTWRTALTDFRRVWNWSSISDNGQYMLASSLADGMFASNDAGYTWRLIANVPTDPVDLGFVHVSKDGSKQYAGYYGGALYESTDYGFTFTERTDVRSGYYYDIAESRDTNILVMFEDPGHMLVSLDAGITWSERMTDALRRWVYVSISSDGSAMAAADNEGYVWFSDNFGDNWTPLFESRVGRWNFAIVVNDDLGVIAGGDDVALHLTRDGGTSFQILTDRIMMIPYGVLSPKGTFYYVELGGHVYRFLYKPSTNLVISAGASSAKTDMSDFVVMTDRRLFGIGYDRMSYGDVSHTLDVNGTMRVRSHVRFGTPLAPSSGGTGVDALSHGLVIANGKEAFTSTNLPNGAMPIGSGDGRVIVESGSALRDHIGLGIGSDVQAWHQNLNDLSKLAPIANHFIMGTGTDFIMSPAESAGDSLGLGDLAYRDHVDNSVWSGLPLSVENGGTGNASFAIGTLPFYDGTVLTTSNVYYDPIHNGVAINAPAVPLGVGLAIAGSDVSLRRSDNVGADLTWNDTDGDYLWRLRSDANGSNFVLSGGQANSNKFNLPDRFVVSSDGRVSIASTVDDAFQVLGGGTFAKDLHVGGTLTVGTETDETTVVLQGSMSLSRHLDASNLTVRGTSHFASEINATDANSASVTFAGGIGVTGRIYNVGGVVINDDVYTASVTNHAAGLTVYRDAEWFNSIPLTDEDRHISLVNTIDDGAVVLSMRNLSAPDGWDVIVEGNAECRSIWQTSTTGKTWMTLSAATGNLVLTSSTDESISTSGGITCAKGVTCNQLMVTDDTSGELSGTIWNDSDSSTAYTLLRLRNDDPTKAGMVFLNSSTRTEDGGASTMTVRNDHGDLRLQNSTKRGLRISDEDTTIEGSVVINSTVDATSSSDGGAATVNGGLSVSKSTFIGGDLTVSGTIVGKSMVTDVIIDMDAVDLINVTTISVERARSLVINEERVLWVNFTVQPTAASQNTQFTFVLPNRTTHLLTSLDINTGQVSGFADPVNYVVLQNMLCVGLPGTVKAMVKFQSVSTEQHYLQAYVSYRTV
jgi:hypothetical protein